MPNEPNRLVNQRAFNRNDFLKNLLNHNCTCLVVPCSRTPSLTDKLITGSWPSGQEESLNLFYALDREIFSFFFLSKRSGDSNLTQCITQDAQYFFFIYNEVVHLFGLIVYSAGFPFLHRIGVKVSQIVIIIDKKRERETN